VIDSSGTFMAGYVIATAIYVVYMVTLWRRAKRVGEQLRKASVGDDVAYAGHPALASHPESRAPPSHPESRSDERIAVHPRLLRPWRESDPFARSARSG
jgi:hypothetical protein